ncbi:sensor histidine kinase [Prochlorothrix hollandica]|uniref:histidine kinase n=1 Tax=Prochlorothrix hollandica PCC 9006 = CALU 1027 TaxID=317619 RepID=A0A0M2PSS8_PROHO|nr:histidine kinase dimerization/phospho-acceptor domain-containing protein [Prochlorothrix hollandica]KKI98202.1 hypothetical protein PROH_21240 [Prochlorothrix hollandica PCC 9006 = CALU 1027]
MGQWLLPTLSELVSQANAASSLGEREPPPDPWATERWTTERWRGAMARSQREWGSAIVALGHLLQGAASPQPLVHSTDDRCPPEPGQYQGLVLCGPWPVFNQPDLLRQLSTWIFLPDLLSGWVSTPLQLLPCASDRPPSFCPVPPQLLPLLPPDPLNGEQFCVALTPYFSLVLVLGETEAGYPKFQFSFDPDCVRRCSQALQARAQLIYPRRAQALEHWLNTFAPVEPSYRLVSQFSRSLVTALGDLGDTEDAAMGDSPQRTPDSSALNPGPDGPESDSGADSQDIQLLQALAHEVRTPLATIRILTRLLLRRRDLAPEVVKQLEVIDHECTEQIDRFNLMFKAAELVADRQGHPPLRSRHLAATALDQVFQASVPRWEKQAQRRSLTLDVVLPPHMPLVVSDSTMLEQALTGLMERFTRHLPSGSHIEVEVSLAGDQLKLQLQANKSNVRSSRSALTPLPNAGDMPAPQFQSLGHLLMLQPETGSVSLNLNVTKNLFEALGGKLKVREKSRQGEVLTLFLPLEVQQG